MTKKQLEKEAQKNCICTDTYMRASYVTGYLAGAEPREKRITELENENAELELKIKKMTQHLEPQEMTALFEQVEEEVKIETENKKAKEIIKELLSILSKENIEGIYEITEEAEQFLRSVDK